MRPAPNVDLLTAALASVADTGAVQCDWLEEATLGALNQRLRGGNYHILHFIGHGRFDEASGEGALLFEDRGRESRCRGQ